MIGLHFGTSFQSFNFSDNKIVASEFGIYLEAEESIVSNNVIECGGVGLFGLFCENTSMSNNRIKVTTTNANLIASGSGVYAGCYCIFIPDGNEDFSITNSTLTLIGTALLGDSANLNVNGCSRYTVDGVRTFQGYTTLASTNAAYHMYLLLTTPSDGWTIQVKNCVINNRLNVPDTESADTSHGLFFGPSATTFTPGDLTSGDITVSGNTIYWPKPLITSEWSTDGSPVVGAFCVHDRTVNIEVGSPTSLRHMIKYRDNKVIANERAYSDTGGISVPNAFFINNPTWLINAAGIGYYDTDSNIYSAFLVTGSAATSFTYYITWATP
jgi:hypothetical protein